MKVLKIFLFLLPVLSCCNKEEIDYENAKTTYFTNLTDTTFDDTTITCVTFNIQLGFKAYQDPWDMNTTGADSVQLKLIADHLISIDPDIIALQEVPLNRYNAAIKDFLGALGTRMNLNYAFASHGYNDPYGIYPVYGEWGTAILSKYKIKSLKNIPVEYVSKWEKRSMLDAEIVINPQKSIHVISLHFLPIDEGIPNALSHLKTLSGPVVVMGDFNNSGEIKDFEDIGLNESDTGFSKMIDRIFFSSDYFLSKGFGIIPAPDSLWYISDHPAIFNRLNFKN